jgi:y4mF family transcriptional regulator
MEGKKKAVKPVEVRPITLEHFPRNSGSLPSSAPPNLATPSSSPLASLFGNAFASPPAPPSNALSSAFGNAFASPPAPPSNALSSAFGNAFASPPAPPSNALSSLLGSTFASPPAPLSSPLASLFSNPLASSPMPPSNALNSLLGNAFASPPVPPSKENPISSVADLGAVVRAAREGMGLTQQQFADLAGVGRRFVSELENGKATSEFGLVLQVCRAAGVDVFARKRR